MKSADSDVKVIMLTGKASQADKIKGKLAGCDDYLVKPVGRNTFQNTVKSYLNERHAPENLGAQHH
jgi:DNA-binding response OmpR family regulator